MKNRLRRLRSELDLTQLDVAQGLRISQPTYQRWEAGLVAIPRRKLADVAAFFQTTPAAVLGQHSTILAATDANSPDLEEYGTVAVTFRSGTPLLLAITEGTRRRIENDVVDAQPFFTVRSLSNETVAIRKAAVTELTFVRTGYRTPDDPVGASFPRFADIKLPDPRDWEIVTAFARDLSATHDYPTAEVARVVTAITIPDPASEHSLEAGFATLSQEALSQAWEARRQRIFALATDTVWQFSSGRLRRVSHVDPEDLYRAFFPLIGYQGEEHGDGQMITLSEGTNRVHRITATALDYVSVPSHSYEEGLTEVDLAWIDKTALNPANQDPSTTPSESYLSRTSKLRPASSH